jgi:hypothetical protein
VEKPGRPADATSDTMETTTTKISYMTSEALRWIQAKDGREYCVDRSHQHHARQDSLPSPRAVRTLLYSIKSRLRRLPARVLAVLRAAPRRQS